MSSPRLNLEYGESLRRQLVEMARSIIEERVPVHEGARSLVVLGHKLEVQSERPFPFIEGVYSEIMQFPVDEVRKRWNPVALAREDANRERIEAQLRPRLVDFCNAILKRFVHSDAEQ